MTLLRTDYRAPVGHYWTRNETTTRNKAATDMEWIRSLAREAREHVGITGEPSEDELDQVAELLGVRVIYAPVACPYAVHTPQGPMIVRPRRWRDEHGNPYAHELGHGATNPGGAEVIRAVWPGDPRKERLARLWFDRDEAYADEFARVLRGC